MTACTQPGCTGTIVDGYCDVCGSPGAPVDAATRHAALAPRRPLRRPPGRPAPVAAALGVANGARCTQPGCTGTIVDGYCDVCGTPAARDGCRAPPSPMAAALSQVTQPSMPVARRRPSPGPPAGSARPHSARSG